MVDGRLADENIPALEPKRLPRLKIIKTKEIFAAMTMCNDYRQTTSFIELSNSQ
jgi:hypothetical protein